MQKEEKREGVQRGRLAERDQERALPKYQVLLREVRQILGVPLFLEIRQSLVILVRADLRVRWKIDLNVSGQDVLEVKET